jgi:hypothetical protein
VRIFLIVRTCFFVSLLRFLFFSAEQESERQESLQQSLLKYNSLEMSAAPVNSGSTVVGTSGAHTQNAPHADVPALGLEYATMAHTTVPNTAVFETSPGDFSIPFDVPPTSMGEPEAPTATSSVTDVALWVASLGPAYEKYTTTFSENSIDGEILFSDDIFSEEMMKERLEITSMFHRKIILKKIAEFKELAKSNSYTAM